MSICEDNVIDIKYVDDSMWLFIFDEADWSKPGQHINILKDKINSYVDFIRKKEYIETCPNYSSNKFVIRIKFAHVPPTEVLPFFTNTSKVLKKQKENISLLVEI